MYKQECVWRILVMVYLFYRDTFGTIVDMLLLYMYGCRYVCVYILRTFILFDSSRAFPSATDGTVNVSHPSLVVV